MSEVHSNFIKTKTLFESPLLRGASGVKMWGRNRGGELTRLSVVMFLILGGLMFNRGCAGEGEKDQVRGGEVWHFNGEDEGGDGVQIVGAVEQEQRESVQGSGVVVTPVQNLVVEEAVAGTDGKDNNGDFLVSCNSIIDGQPGSLVQLPIARNLLQDPFSFDEQFRESISQGVFNFQELGPENWEKGIEPLTRYALDQFVMVGAITGVKKPMALVVDPDGGSHVVKVGQLIGKEKARINSIKNDTMVVHYGASSVLGSRSGQRIFRLRPKHYE